MFILLVIFILLKLQYLLDIEKLGFKLGIDIEH